MARSETALAAQVQRLRGARAANEQNEDNRNGGRER